MRKDRYRIKQYGINNFEIQYKLFGLIWVNATEYGSYSLEDARQTIKAWEASEAVSGRVYEP